MKRFVIACSVLFSLSFLVSCGWGDAEKSEDKKPEFVDLGLPSGTKWADCNVGADSPEDAGDFYAWGETVTKKEYTTKNCSTYEKEMNDIGGNPEYDAVSKKWGEKYRMPSKADFEELLDEKNCEIKITEQNGVKGYKITSKRNGNSIFFPMSGCWYYSKCEGKGEYATYWTSTPEGTMSGCALILTDYTCGVGFNFRNYGCPIRPVMK